MEIGKVVAFFEQKKILCAVCLEVKENKFHLLSEENREITLGRNRIVHISSEPLEAGLSRDSLVERLKRLVEHQKVLMKTFSIKDLWELVCGEGEAFSLRDLTELVFDRRASFDHEMALLRGLFDDRVYFKQRGDLYEPQNPEKVEQTLLQLEREAEEERELQEASAWLAGVWAGIAGPPPEKKEKIVALLKEIALFGPEAPEDARGKILLQRAKITSPEAPFELLVRLGEWSEDENLFLHRYQVPQAFPDKVLVDAEKIISRASKEIPTHPQDQDLGFLHPLTIDSEFTRDIDDALSLERVGEDYQVGIHIADVATFLNGHKEIFQEARARAISIYLPDQRIPMIPPLLSEGICSLVAGERRRALSFLVRLDQEGRVQEYQILPGVIQVTRRLSYDLADQLLQEEEEELTCLQRMAEKLFRRRMGSGAFFIPRPERMIRVSREKEIFIFKRDRESPSQKMVSEFMILANCLAALFLKEKNIPAIYRGQMDPQEKSPPMDKFDPLQAYQLRRVMNRAEVSTRPARHSGLGAEAYLTLTSPIRRFYDLLMEQQVLGALGGSPPLTEAKLTEIITFIQPALSRVGSVEELSERYWILRYLEKRVGSTTKGIVLDRFPNKYLVHLYEYLLEVDMAVTSGRNFVPGDQLLIRVEKVNARSGVLKIAPA